MNNPAPSLIRFPIAAVVHRALITDPGLSPDADPAASRAVAALATADTVIRGKGLSHVVTIDPEAAGVIWQRCLAIEGDTTQKKTLRASLREVIARINHEIRRADWTYPTVGRLPQRRVFVVPVHEGEERRNPTPLPNGRHWTGADTDHAIVAGPGEPTRTAADIRVAVGDMMERYLALHPFDTPVHQATIAIAATMITSDHYRTVCSFSITRSHLRKYLDVADEAR